MTRVGEVHRQLFALGQHVLDALVRGVAAGQHLAVEQQRVARLPARDFFLGQGVEVDLLALLVSGAQSTLGHRSRLQGRRVNGPLPSITKWAWRVAAQLGIIAIGLLAACVGTS